ncbi:MAG: hypothetical protein PVI23_00690 [Maricaulaceae bacterium]|jgi:hypothetical protein
MSGGDVIESVSRHWSDTPRRARGRLKTHWFSRWEPSLDDALLALPTIDELPADLYRALAISRRGQAKRIGLVLDGEDPVMVAVLRADRSKTWRAAAEDISPSAAFPARPGDYFAACAALGVRLELSFRKPPEPIPAGGRVRVERAVSTYSLGLLRNPTKHWRASRYDLLVEAARACPQARRRYLLMDAYGQAEWAFRRAARAPGSDPGRLLDLELAANHFAATGQRRTATLYEDDTPIAAMVFLVRDNTLMAKLAHVEGRADKLALASLHEQTIGWARSQGYVAIDYDAHLPLASQITRATGKRTHVAVLPSSAVRAAAAVARRKLGPEDAPSQPRKRPGFGLRTP